MDRKTQQFSRGFQATFGDYRFLGMMDIIAPELSSKDVQSARNIMGQANAIFASIAYNSQERRFTLWAAEQARKQLLDKIDGRAWDREEAKSITRNFVVTKHKQAVHGKNLRPKGLRGNEWHIHNTQRKEADNE